jgi:stage IV sporulation protein FB
VFLQEPQPTQGDLNFNLLGFPVRVHPMFWLMTALMAWSGGELPPQILVIWIGVVFVSILVHELGHALAARYFGGQASIVLYQFGGLAIHFPQPRYTWQRVAISLAGPVAGFLLAIATMIVVGATGHKIQFVLAWIPFEWELIQEFNAELAVRFLMDVNIFWGLFNLMPIYPLDGGQVARNLLVRYDHRDGLRKSQWLSVIAAVGLAVYVWYATQGSMMLTVLMLGFLAFQNYQELRSPWGSRNPW